MMIVSLKILNVSPNAELQKSPLKKSKRAILQKSEITESILGRLSGQLDCLLGREDRWVWGPTRLDRFPKEDSGVFHARRIRSLQAPACSPRSLERTDTFRKTCCWEPQLPGGEGPRWQELAAEPKFCFIPRGSQGSQRWARWGQGPSLALLAQRFL